MGERCAQDQAEQMGAGRVLVTCPLRMLLVSAHESSSLHRMTPAAEAALCKSQGHLIQVWPIR